MPNTESDDQLVARAIEGDKAAMTALLVRHDSDIRRSLAGRIPKRHQSMITIDEVMQDAYTAVFLNIHRFELQGLGSFPAWVTQIARNSLANVIKRLDAGKRRPPSHCGVERDEAYETLFNAIASSGTTPSRQAMRNEIRTTIEALLDELPPVHKEVVRLYDLEGLSAAGVAGRVGRSPGAVYMIRARAHERLRELLGPSSNYLTTGSEASAREPS